MRAITFTIELLQPMLATGLEGDPNAGVSLYYIPGSVLRGAIIGLYLRNKGGKELSLSNDERRLFFDGTVRYLNSYPLVVVREEPVRSLPVPLGWQKLKDREEAEDFFDFALTTPVEQDPKGKEQFKNLSSPFFVFKDPATIVAVKPDTRLAVHTQRNPRKGRAVEEDGAVFRYESVAAGTKFKGAIISIDKDRLKEIRNWIDGAELSLGGSRTGGYGRAQVIEVSDVKDDWLEPQLVKATSIGAPNLDEQSYEFTITLLSNALIRDGNGQFCADLFESALSLTKGDLEPVEEKTFKRAEIIGGFNRRWGLPLPQAISLKAGSVFTFKARKEIPANVVQKWLDEGVGERRLDGFGRVAVNLNKDRQDYLLFGEADTHKPMSVALQFEPQTTIAQTIVKRVLRQRLDSRLTAQIGQYEIKTVPRNSQISRLRLLLREVLRREKEIEAIKEFFSDLKKPAREQFENARVLADGSPKGKLKDWVINVASETSLFNEAPVALGNDDGKIEARSDDLQWEYNLRLIDGVLARTAKQNQQ